MRIARHVSGWRSGRCPTAIGQERMPMGGNTENIALKSTPAQRPWINPHSARMSVRQKYPSNGSGFFLISRFHMGCITADTNTSMTIFNSIAYAPDHPRPLVHAVWTISSCHIYAYTYGRFFDSSNRFCCHYLSTSLATT